MKIIWERRNDLKDLKNELSDFESVKGVDEVEKKVNDIIIIYLFDKLEFEEQVEILEECIIECRKLPNLNKEETK